MAKKINKQSQSNNNSSSGQSFEQYILRGPQHFEEKILEEYALTYDNQIKDFNKAYECYSFYRNDGYEHALAWDKCGCHTLTLELQLQLRQKIKDIEKELEKSASFDVDYSSLLFKTSKKNIKNKLNDKLYIETLAGKREWLNSAPPIVNNFVQLYQNSNMDLGNKVFSKNIPDNQKTQALYNLVSIKMNELSKSFMDRIKLTPEFIFDKINKADEFLDVQTRQIKRQFFRFNESERESFLEKVASDNNEKKEVIVKEWLQNLTEQYPDVLFQYIIIDKLCLKPNENKIVSPFPYIAQYIENIYKTLTAKVGSFSLEKQYLSNVPRPENGWLEILNNRTKENEKDIVDNTKILALLTADTGWCIAGYETAQFYLIKNDFHLFFENSKPVVAIRIEGIVEKEIKGINNKPPIGYVDIIEDKLVELNASKSSSDYRNLIEAKKMNDQIASGEFDFDKFAELIQINPDNIYKLEPQFRNNPTIKDAYIKGCIEAILEDPIFYYDLTDEFMDRQDFKNAFLEGWRRKVLNEEVSIDEVPEEIRNSESILDAHKTLIIRDIQANPIDFYYDFFNTYKLTSKTPQELKEVEDLKQAIILSVIDLLHKKSESKDYRHNEETFLEFYKEIPDELKNTEQVQNAIKECVPKYIRTHPNVINSLPPELKDLNLVNQSFYEGIEDKLYQGIYFYNTLDYKFKVDPKVQEIAKKVLISKIQEGPYQDEIYLLPIILYDDEVKSALYKSWESTIKQYGPGSYLNSIIFATRHDEQIAEILIKMKDLFFNYIKEYPDQMFYVNLEEYELLPEDIKNNSVFRKNLINTLKIKVEESPYDYLNGEYLSPQLRPLILNDPDVYSSLKKGIIIDINLDNSNGKNLPEQLYNDPDILKVIVSYWQRHAKSDISSLNYVPRVLWKNPEIKELFVNIYIQNLEVKPDFDKWLFSSLPEVVKTDVKVLNAVREKILSDLEYFSPSTVSIPEELENDPIIQQKIKEINSNNVTAQIKDLEYSKEIFQNNIEYRLNKLSNYIDKNIIHQVLLDQDNIIKINIIDDKKIPDNITPLSILEKENGLEVIAQKPNFPEKLIKQANSFSKRKIAIIGFPSETRDKICEKISSFYSIELLNPFKIFEKAVELGIFDEAEFDQNKNNLLDLPNEIINFAYSVLEHHLEGFVIEGYPITVEQLENMNIDAVIFLDSNLNKMIKLKSNRRWCPTCHRLYHLNLNPPIKRDEKNYRCDRCGGKLITRPEDKKDYIKDQYYNWRTSYNDLLKKLKTKDNFLYIKDQEDTEKIIIEIHRFIKQSQKN